MSLNKDTKTSCVILVNNNHTNEIFLERLICIIRVVYGKASHQVKRVNICSKLDLALFKYILT